MRRLMILASVLAVALGSSACGPMQPAADSASAEADSSYYFVFLNPNPDRLQLSPEQADSLQAGHMDNIRRLYEEDKLDVAGPLEGGGGIFLIKAPDRFEARQYVDTDPAIQAARFLTELFPFEISVGGVCPVADGAEMAQYGFLRFRGVESAQDPADNEDQREALSESGELIFSGWFDSGAEGVMIVRSTADSLLHNIAQAHPGVAEGSLTPELRRIWVGKGVFCE